MVRGRSRSGVARCRGSSVDCAVGCSIVCRDTGTDDASGRPDRTRPGALSGTITDDVSGRPDSRRPAALPATRDLEALARGLGRLGYPRGEALARLGAAEEEIASESRAPSDAELIRRVLRGGG